MENTNRLLAIFTLAVTLAVTVSSCKKEDETPTATTPTTTAPTPTGTGGNGATPIDTIFYNGVEVTLYFADGMGNANIGKSTVNPALKAWNEQTVTGKVYVSLNGKVMETRDYKIVVGGGSGHSGTRHGLNLGNLISGDVVSFEYSEGTISNGDSLVYCDSIETNWNMINDCGYWYNGVQFTKIENGLQFFRFEHYVDTIPHGERTVDAIKYSYIMK